MKKRRSFIRKVSFLSALVIVLAIWAGVSTFKLNKLKNQVQISRERALTQLGTYLDDIDLNLQKSMYCASESQMSDITTKLWRSSSSAKESLSEITDGNTEISALYKFLSQVGEYTLSLNEKIASGEELSEKETENLNKLKSYSSEISQKVNYLINQGENGYLDFEEVKSTLEKTGDERLIFGNEISDTVQSMEDYPTLVYDGPFSDNINEKKSEIIEALAPITREEAQQKAAEYLGVKIDEIYFLSNSNGNLEVYNFYNATKTVAVSQNGGLLVSIISSLYAGESKITADEAIAKGKEYLNILGYTSVKDSYYSVNDGICTVNFAYWENDITYYTDLIKVSISMENGEITAFDATGYLMNHKAREIPQNLSYTLESGGALLREGLSILAVKKAYIPTDWGNEYFVYEYHCKASDGQEILVYIDPQTGEERDILILLYSDGGILTK